jgi:hypothetical protein
MSRARAKAAKGGGSMAKKKGKGKKKGGSKGKSKGPGKAKHSLLGEASIVYDAAKMLLSDEGGKTLGGRIVGTLTGDKADRQWLSDEIMDPNTVLKRNLRNETKEVQYVYGERVAEGIPGLGKQLRRIRGMLNTAARPVTGKDYNLL